MVETIARIVLGVLFAALCWGVFVPVMFALATPVIMYLALFGKGEYKENILTEYRRLWRFWKDLGWLMVPPW